MCTVPYQSTGHSHQEQTQQKRYDRARTHYVRRSGRQLQHSWEVTPTVGLIIINPTITRAGNRKNGWLKEGYQISFDILKSLKFNYLYTSFMNGREVVVKEVSPYFPGIFRIGSLRIRATACGRANITMKHVDWLITRGVKMKIFIK